jgi:hypothetical protein
LFDSGAVGDPTHQQHDWEPGIAPSGLFWTIPISRSSIQVEPGTGEARLRAADVPVTDYHDFFNAIGGGGPAPLPSHVSFDVRWAGHGERRKIRDDTFGFVGHFVTGACTVRFSASDDGGGVIYTSDPDGQYNPTPAQGGAGAPAVGHERNGVFFTRKRDFEDD